MTVLAAVLLVVTSIALLWTGRVMIDGLTADKLPPRDVRLRHLRRMGYAIGWWQITVGLCIVSLGEGWASAVSVFGMGLLFVGGSWVSGRLGLGPWWAPE